MEAAIAAETTEADATIRLFHLGASQPGVGRFSAGVEILWLRLLDGNLVQNADRQPAMGIVVVADAVTLLPQHGIKKRGADLFTGKDCGQEKTLSETIEKM